MTIKRVIVDRRFEPLLDGTNFSWFSVSTMEEVVGILRSWKCERVLLHHRFAPNLSAIPSNFPLTLVFEREFQPPSLDRIIPLISHLDIVVPRKLLTGSFQEILAAEPYLSRWSEEWVNYYPEASRRLLSFNQNLLKARALVDRRHWRVFQEWAEEAGNIAEVARTVGRHPKTVRHSLSVVSDSLGIERIDQISRNSLKELLRLLDHPDPWQEEQ